MKQAIKITLIIIGVVVLLSLLGVLIFSGYLPYYFLTFSNSCAQQCLNEKFSSSRCVTFPSAYESSENMCGDGGMDIGKTSDCRTPPGIFGGSKQCCCYN